MLRNDYTDAQTQTDTEITQMRSYRWIRREVKVWLILNHQKQRNQSISCLDLF